MLNQYVSQWLCRTDIFHHRHLKLGKASLSCKGKLYNPTIKRKKYVSSFKIDRHTSGELIKPRVVSLMWIQRWENEVQFEDF